MNDEEPLAELFRALLAESESRSEANERLYRYMKESPANRPQGTGSYLSKATVHWYKCKRGCRIAQVFRAGGTTLCAVSDYKLSHGLNLNQSVEAARKKNTLDGERWWPSHVFDLQHEASSPEFLIPLNCSHFRGARSAAEMLEEVGTSRPGKFGQTRL